MGRKTYGYGLHMITKREKLQYAYVFLTDLVTLAVSTALTYTRDGAPIEYRGIR